MASTKATKTVEATAPKYTVAVAEANKHELAKEYTAEEKVPVYLAPLYKPYFGNVMPVCINGISIFFPVDGTTHMVPRSYAAIIEERRQAVDAIINKQGRMANISSNVETSPGELELI